MKSIFVLCLYESENFIEANYNKKSTNLLCEFYNQWKFVLVDKFLNCCCCNLSFHVISSFIKLLMPNEMPNV